MTPQPSAGMAAGPFDARAFGCTILFALPFAATGLTAAVQLLGLLAGRASPGSSPLALGVAAVVFGGFGIGTIAFAVWYRRHVRAALERRAAHPDAPWRWRDDWAESAVRGAGRSPIVAAWALAIFCSALSSPIPFLFAEEWSRGNRVVLVALVFPLISIGLLTWAARLTLRHRRFGAARLRLRAVPVPVGGTLAGTLEVPFDHPPERGVTLRLACVRAVSRREDDGNTSSERTLWQTERHVPSESIDTDFTGAHIAVAFDLPAGQPPADPPDVGGSTASRVAWRLEAEAAVPGVDFRATFELPVFGRVDPPAEPRTVATSATPPVPAGRPDRPTVIVREADPTGTEYVFAAGRATHLVIGLGLALVILTAIVWATTLLGAPWFFPAITTGIGLGLLALFVDVAFVATHTVVTRDGITVRNRAFGIERTRHVPAADVRAVLTGVGMAQARTVTHSARAWYDIRIERLDGGTVRAGRHIADRTEAEWLARHMHETLGAAGRRSL